MRNSVILQTDFFFPILLGECGAGNNWAKGFYTNGCNLLAVDSGFPGAGFQSLSWELGFWITILSEIPDSLRCIPDSKARDSGFQEQTFPRFGNPDSLTWGDVMERLHYGMHALECSHVACLKRDSMYSCCMCSCSRTT